jgi:hypothetical protein
VTIAEAAELTGLSKIALRRRVRRGTIRSVLREGVHRIPLSELYREGLAVPGEDGSRGTADEPTGTHLVRPDRRAQPLGTPSREVMLDRLLAQERIGELRSLSAQAESLRAAVETERRARELIEAELHEACARIVELEVATASTPGPSPTVPAARRWWAP